MSDEAAAERKPGPIGLALSAESFFQAAEFLQNGIEKKLIKPRFDMPVYMMYTHAIELILKAYLSAKGMSEQKLKAAVRRHSVAMLWREAQEHGLSVADKTRYLTGIIEMLEPYASQHEFRYFKIGAITLPKYNEMKLAAKLLLEVALPACREASRLLKR